MAPKTAALPHMGRKIERIRTIMGIKQDMLAQKLGITQGTLSKIEQSEKIDDVRLQQIASAFNMSVDAIKNFNEEAVLNLIQNNNDSSTNNSLIAYQFNSIEKVVELYERLLTNERKKVEQLEAQLKKKNAGAK